MAHGYPDWEGGKSGLYLMPEWAAKEATDKNFRGIATDKGYPLGITVAYTVPIGKTLYITNYSFRLVASNVADADKNQIGVAYVFNFTDAIVYSEIGGNGGGSVSLNKPLRFAGGKIANFIANCYANHDCDVVIAANGYEV